MSRTRKSMSPTRKMKSKPTPDWTGEVNMATHEPLSFELLRDLYTGYSYAASTLPTYGSTLNYFDQFVLDPIYGNESSYTPDIHEEDFKDEDDGELF